MSVVVTIPPLTVPCGDRIWICSTCGHQGRWDEEAGWVWFGNYTIIGRGSQAYEHENIEAVICPKCPKDKGPMIDG